MNIECELGFHSRQKQYTFFLLLYKLQTSSGTHPAYYLVGSRKTSAGFNRQDCEAGHSPPSCAEVKNGWATALLPTRLHGLVLSSLSTRKCWPSFCLYRKIFRDEYNFKHFLIMRLLPICYINTLCLLCSTLMVGDHISHYLNLLVIWPEYGATQRMEEEATSISLHFNSLFHQNSWEFNPPSH